MNKTLSFNTKPSYTTSSFIECTSSSSGALCHTRTQLFIYSKSTISEQQEKNYLIKFIYRSLPIQINHIETLKHLSLEDLKLMYLNDLSKNTMSTRFLQELFFGIQKSDLKNYIISFCYGKETQNITKSYLQISDFLNAVNRDSTLINSFLTIIEPNKDKIQLYKLLKTIATQKSIDGVIKSYLDEESLRECLFIALNYISPDELVNLFKTTISYLNDDRAKSNSLNNTEFKNYIISFCYSKQTESISKSINKISNFNSAINRDLLLINSFKSMITSNEDDHYLHSLLTLIETQELSDSLIISYFDENTLKQCLFIILNYISVDRLKNLFKKTIFHLKELTTDLNSLEEDNLDYSSESDDDYLFDTVDDELNNSDDSVYTNESNVIPLDQYKNKLYFFRKLFKLATKPTIFCIAEYCIKKNNDRYLLFLLFTSTEKILVNDLYYLMKLAINEHNAFAIHDILFACCFYEKTKKQSINCSTNLLIYNDLFNTAIDYVMEHINNTRSQTPPYFCITKLFQPNISILTEDESFSLQSKIFIHALKQNTAVDLIADLKKYFIYTKNNFELNNIKIAIKLINILYVYTNDIKVLKEINKQFNSFKYLVKSFKQDAIDFILNHSKKEGILEKKRFLENNIHNHILGKRITNPNLDSYVKSLTFKDLF